MSSLEAEELEMQAKLLEEAMEENQVEACQSLSGLGKDWEMMATMPVHMLFEETVSLASSPEEEEEEEEEASGYSSRGSRETVAGNGHQGHEREGEEEEEEEEEDLSDEQRKKRKANKCCQRSREKSKRKADEAMKKSQELEADYWHLVPQFNARFPSETVPPPFVEEDAGSRLKNKQKAAKKGTKKQPNGSWKERPPNELKEMGAGYSQSYRYRSKERLEQVKRKVTFYEETNAGLRTRMELKVEVVDSLREEDVAQEVKAKKLQFQSMEKERKQLVGKAVDAKGRTFEVSDGSKIIFFHFNK